MVSEIKDYMNIQFKLNCIASRNVYIAKLRNGSVIWLMGSY